MRNDENFRHLLTLLVETAEREDPTDGYLLDECREIARGLTDFLDEHWNPTPEEMLPWLRETIFCAVTFGKEVEAVDTLKLLARLPELHAAMIEN